VSNSVQIAVSGRRRLCSWGDVNKIDARQEAVMNDADLLSAVCQGGYARVLQSHSENEKQTLIQLACTWARAALMSERVFESSFITSPRDIGEATSLARS
jgi:hypothetical protein